MLKYFVGSLPFMLHHKNKLKTLDLSVLLTYISTQSIHFKVAYSFLHCLKNVYQSHFVNYTNYGKLSLRVNTPYLEHITHESK